STMSCIALFVSSFCNAAKWITDVKGEASCHEGTSIQLHKGDKRYAGMSRIVKVSPCGEAKEYHEGCASAATGRNPLVAFGFEKRGIEAGKENVVWFSTFPTPSSPELLFLCRGLPARSRWRYAAPGSFFFLFLLAVFCR